MSVQDTIFDLLISSSCPSIRLDDNSVYDDEYLRNISIMAPSGSYVDIGGTQQEYSLSLTNALFVAGNEMDEVLTLFICSEILDFTIPNVYNESSFDCMMHSLAEAINNATNGDFDNITAVYDSDTNLINIVYNEPGILFTLSASYSKGSSYYEVSEITPASPSMDHTESGNNTLSYTTSEDGGKYTIKITVWSDSCNKISETYYLWNWCYTYKQLDECFINLVKDEECGCGCKKCKFSKATELKNKMEAAKLEEVLTGSGPAVQKIIDSALAICNEDDCNCN